MIALLLKNPSYPPFVKGRNYPPLWKRGVRGDFLIKCQLLIFPHHCRHHPSNLKLTLRSYRLIPWICRYQRSHIPAFSQVLHGPLPVYLSNNNVTALWDLCPVYYSHVPRKYARLNHGITGDLKQKRRLTVLNKEVIKRERVRQLLLSSAWKPGIYSPKDPDT